MPDVEGLPPGANVPEPIESQLPEQGIMSRAASAVKNMLGMGGDVGEQGVTSQQLASIWKKRIEAAQELRKKNKTPETWQRWMDKAAGRWKKIGRGDNVYVNKPYSVVRAVTGQTYSRNPSFRVVPRSDDFFAEKSADDQTVLLNYYVENIGLKREGKMATKQAHVIGHSWLKTFWVSNPVQVEQPPMPGPVGPDGMPGVLMPQPPIEIDMGSPHVRWVRSEDVFPDPEASRWEDMRWIAHKVVRPTEAVKRDARYINTENLKGTVKSTAGGYTLNLDDQGYEPKNKSYDSERTILWEIEDFEHQRIVTVAEGHDEVLRDEQDPYVVLGDIGMWVQIESDEDLDRIEGTGIMHIIEPMSDELNLIRTRSLNHAKRALIKLLVQKGMLTQEAMDDLISGDDLGVVEVSDPNAIKPLDIPNVPMESAKAEASAKSDIAESSGSSELQRGESPQGNQTATEIAVIGQNERIAVSARIDIIEEAMKRVGRKLLKLMRTYMKTEQAVRILGPEGQVTWRRFTPSEITGEYDVTVEYGSTVQKDQIENRQIAMNLYNLLQNEPVIGSRRVELVKDILRAFDRKDVDRYIDPEWMLLLMSMGGKPLSPGGPGAPIPGIASAKPPAIGDRLAAGPPKGGEGPTGPVPTPGSIRAGAMGALNLS